MLLQAKALTTAADWAQAYAELAKKQDVLANEKDALAKEGFQMRRVVLTPKVGKEPTKAEE